MAKKKAKQRQVLPEPPAYTRRHSRLYEIVLLSFPFQLLFGLMLVIYFSALPRFGPFFWSTIDKNSTYTLMGVAMAFAFITITLRRLLRYPGVHSVAYVLPTALAYYAVLVFVFFVSRIIYSNETLFLSFLLTLLWCYTGYFIGHRYRKNRYALVPFGEALEFENIHGAFFELLQAPDITGQRFNAIIADLRSEITPEWEKFLAHCTLSRIPVYHTRQIRESLTGRVKIDHLSENEFGALLPSDFYRHAKRLIDFLGAVALIPLLIPVFALIGLAIRLESRGPVFFVQQRMGYRGRIFPMIKFRTMHTDQKGQKFTKDEQDPRITGTGRILRRYRIDELPQVWNVLIGQMSFIGPRPESLDLSLWYEKDVPFFSYRHVVRPGISGWAQVNQGYAAEVDAMNIKLEYDFYYIKHFSFWLDALITFKTVKTIVTGFGAR